IVLSQGRPPFLRVFKADHTSTSSKQRNAIPTRVAKATKFTIIFWVLVPAEGNMLKTQKFTIAEIYVPVKRRKTLRTQTVADLAQNMLECGQRSPILVRQDGL